MLLRSIPGNSFAALQTASLPEQYLQSNGGRMAGIPGKRCLQGKTGAFVG